MKFIGVTICSVAFVVICWLGRGSARMINKMGSAISVEATTIDIGNLSVGQVGKAIFKITNKANGPVHIDRLVPECSCMRIESYDPDISPGASRSVAVSMTMDDALAMGFRKGLELVITGEHTETILLRITGKSVGIRDAAVFPGHLAFGEVKAGTAVHKSLYVVGDARTISSVPLDIELIAGMDNNNRIELQDASAEGAPPWPRPLTLS